MTKVDKTLLDLRGRYAWACALGRALTFVRLGLCLCLALVAIDVVLQCGAWTRLLLDVVALAALVGVIAWLARRARREARDRRGLAMILEQEHEHLDNVLINAVEFKDRLGRGEAGASAALMRHEIARAEERVASIRPEESVPRERIVRERNVLIALGLLLLVTLLSAPSAYLAVLPRYLDPFGDHPPFSLTTFDVDPEGTEVFYGEDVTIQATIGGRTPKKLALVTVADDGTEERLTLFRTAPGKYFQKIAGLKESLTYYVAAPRGRSKRYRLKVILFPRFEQVLATCDYPEYTHLEPRTEAVGEKGIEAVQGTKVALEITSNRPLGGGRIALKPAGVYGEAPRPLSPDTTDPVRVRGGFGIRESGTFSLALVDVDGIASRDAFERPIRALEDRAPRISFVMPCEEAMSTPDHSVPVEVEADDDYGLSRIEIRRRVNKSPAAKETAAVKRQPTRVMSHTTFFDMKQLGVKPGDVVEYHATATDNHPKAPRSTATTVRRIRVISLEEYQRLVRQEQTVEDLPAKYEAIEAEIRELAEAQKKIEERLASLQERAAEAAEQGQELTEPEKKELKELTEQQHALTKETESLADQLDRMAKEPPLYAVEKAFQEKLAEMAQQLRRIGRDDMGRAEKQMRGAQGQKADRQAPALSQASQAQRGAARRLGQMAGGMQREISQPLGKMADVLRLYEDAERFKNLAERQADLVGQLEEFRSTRGSGASEAAKQRMQQLGREQRSLQQELEGLRQDLAKHGKALGKDFPKLSESARGLAGKMKQKRIAQHMSDAAGQLSLGFGANGYESAAKALAGMRSLGDECEGCGAGNKHCPFADHRLERAMGMGKGGLGPTLEQFTAALCERLAQGKDGGKGGTGQGEGGYSGALSSSRLYGPNSPIGGDGYSGRTKEPLHTDSREHKRPLARSTAESVSEDKRRIEFTSGAPDRYADEYKKLVEEYFKVVSEEEEE